MDHCLNKLDEILARGTDDRRSVLQLGYNLGRLSELSGLGRSAFWDQWKGPVERWDLPSMQALAQSLRRDLGSGPETLP